MSRQGKTMSQMLGGLEFASRSSQRIERRAAAKYLCDMPGDGDWSVTAYMGTFVAASPVHGVFVLEIHTEKGALYGQWEKVKPHG